MLLRDFNAICDTHIDCVSSNQNKRENSCFNDPPSHFQLTDRYRLDYLDALQLRTAACKVSCLLTTTAKWWVRDAVAKNVQACTEAGASLNLPGRYAGVVSVC